jgi:hypothetical protein
MLCELVEAGVPELCDSANIKKKIINLHYGHVCWQTEAVVLRTVARPYE